MEPQPPWEPDAPPPAPDNSHPIRVVVTDDLQRWRLTVFFRFILAIPLLLWLLIWSIGAFFAAIANWVATLIKGKPPRGLYEFFASYVRFATHVYAYLLLAADPYPGFTGQPGYPVDVEIAPRAPQSRWKTAFRFFLALPAIILAEVFTGDPGFLGGNNRSGSGSSDWWNFELGTGVGLFFVSVLAWFACLARGRMPQGFRDLMAYGLRYAAQAWGYLFFLTDRYPDADPAEPPAAPPEKPRTIRLVLADDLRRSRLTVFFRFLLFLPHLVWLALWSLAAWLAAVANWFATLVLGRSPAPLHRFLAAYVRYTVTVYAYVFIVANPFPGFVGAPGTYPVEVEIDGPKPQHRLKTAFRLPLAIPAFIVNSALSSALFFVAIFGWFVSLALGRMPKGLRNLGAWAIRYGAEAEGYLFLLTDTYPYSGPWEFALPAPAPPEAEPEPEPEAAFA
ncbi:MAG: DUF4389 domain-containing protein [Gaiellaceae bacterium]